MSAIRAAVFYAGLIVVSLLFGILELFIVLLPRQPGYWLLSRWNVFALWWLRRCCRIDYRIIGREHLPAHGPYVVMAAHQSAFETILLVLLLPQPTFVLKRELLWIPFFGWGLALTRPIAICRASPVRSLKHLLTQARERLARGEVIAVFPEGTRTPIGVRQTYQKGGAHMACANHVPVVPIAHNAGHFWPKGFLKHPGTITMQIGAAIDTTELAAAQLNEQVRDWVEQAGAQMTPPV